MTSVATGLAARARHFRPAVMSTSPGLGGGRILDTGLGEHLDLFRRSLHAYLLEAGEEQVAELFATDA